MKKDKLPIYLTNESFNAIINYFHFILLLINYYIKRKSVRIGVKGRIDNPYSDYSFCNSYKKVNIYTHYSPSKYCSFEKHIYNSVVTNLNYRGFYEEDVRSIYDEFTILEFDSPNYLDDDQMYIMHQLLQDSQAKEYISISLENIIKAIHLNNVRVEFKTATEFDIHCNALSKYRMDNNIGYINIEDLLKDNVERSLKKTLSNFASSIKYGLMEYKSLEAIEFAKSYEHIRLKKQYDINHEYAEFCPDIEQVFGYGENGLPVFAYIPHGLPFRTVAYDYGIHDNDDFSIWFKDVKNKESFEQELSRRLSDKNITYEVSLNYPNSLYVIKKNNVI